MHDFMYWEHRGWEECKTCEVCIKEKKDKLWKNNFILVNNKKC